jgi:DNA-binding NtrC family response regulator
MSLDGHAGQPSLSVHTVPPAPRGGRSELRQVLAALGAALAEDSADVDLRSTFELALQRALSLRSIRLREIPPRYNARLVTPTRTVDSIVLGVPSGDPQVQAVLEALGGPDRQLSDSDHDLLVTAAQLGGLVLEAVRRRPAARSVPRLPQSLVGNTPLMQALRERVERVAATDFTVLIEGESGTGKELVARQLHERSRRRTGPFVAVNCAAVVETLLEAELFGIEERTATGVRGRRGKFEHADGGTLFLDEVSDLSLSAQAKLLRAIQDLAVERVGGRGVHQVDTRIVAATNRSLAEMVDSKLFRPDLFYRLSGVDVHVPPLRVRQSDVLELAEYFLQRYQGARQFELSPAVKDAFFTYTWPGNVRELQRVIEGIIALGRGQRVELDDLPPNVRGDYEAVLGPSLERHDSMRDWGSRYARLVLQRCNDNKRQACHILDISYHTLQAYLRRSERPPRADRGAWPKPAQRTGTGHGSAGGA